MAISFTQLAQFSPGSATSLLSSSSGNVRGSSLASALSSQITSQAASLILSRLTSDERTVIFQNALTNAVALERSAQKLLGTHLEKSAALMEREVVSGDSTKVTGEADALASARTLGIDITQIAVAHEVVSDTLLANDTHGLGSGNKNFKLNIDNTNYSMSVNLSLEITNLDLLQAIADEINSEVGIGVNAVVYQDTAAGTVYLSVKARETGTDYDFAMDDTSGNVLNSLNMEDDDGSADPANGDGGTLTQAQNAIYTIDGAAVPVTSQSNEIDLYSNTVHLTLVAPTSGDPVTITVQPSTSGISTEITNFVSDYNDLLDFALSNKSELTTPLAAKLSQAIAQNVTGLSEIGITVGSDGLLDIDLDDLETAIAGTDFRTLERTLLSASGLAITADQVTRDFLQDPNTFLTSPHNPVSYASLKSIQTSETTGMLLNLVL